MKKRAVKYLLSVISLSAMVSFIGCSSDASSVHNSPDSQEEPENDNQNVGEPSTSQTVTSSVVTSSVVWTFNDLGSLQIEGVNADTALSDAASLQSAQTVYTTFSAVSNAKFSLKADVDYPSSDKSLTAQIKSLGEDSSTPIQYNKYESSVSSCSQSDATKGALQIQDDAIVINGVQGPFKIKLNYGANSNTAKTDGRYAYVKIDGTEYDDETVKAAKSLTAKGSGFTTEYSGSDSVTVVVGSKGSSAGVSLVRLYDIIISKEQTLTTTVTKTTASDGSVTTVTVVTDEDGNVISETTETVKAETGSDSGNTGTDPTASEEYTNGSKIGRRSRLNEIDTASLSKAVYVSTASDFEAALKSVEAGGAIVLAGGTYSFDHQVTIELGNDGSESAMKYIMPARGEKVTLDFSSQSYDSSDTSKNARGLQINADWWHVYGLTVYGAADNGIFVAGKHNIIERCVLEANRDTGLQISRRASSVTSFDDWPSDNLILNCTAFDNHDPATDENADGFAAKLTCGSGNVFDGCIAYCNSDDGWDLYAKEATGSIGVVTIKNCVAFSNGRLTTGSSFANGDMNGFKLGGSNGKVPTAHVIYNCLAFSNGHSGFTDNGNGGALSLTACTAYNNEKTNFNFDRTAGGSFYKLITAGVPNNGSERFAGSSGTSTIKNVLYFNSKKYYYVEESTVVSKGDKVGTEVSDPYTSEFKSQSAPALDGNVDSTCRNADGTINLNGFLETKDSSTYAALGARFRSEAWEVLDVSIK